MITSFFRRKSIFSKITSLFTIFALLVQMVGPIPLARAISTPDVLGDYTIEFTCNGGYEGCEAWGPLVHTMTIDTQSDSNFSGHGEATIDSSPWDMEGTIIEPNVTLNISYTGAKTGYMIDLTGTRTDDGNMTGTATDGTGTFTWHTTSVPPQDEKVNICHKTDSESNPWNALRINQNSLNTHLDHGDFLYAGPVDNKDKPTDDDWCADNVPVESVTVTATKIVCDAEAYLPNWATGDNGAPSEITATTATNWLAQGDNSEHCRLQSGWDFQWGDQSTGYPGDTFVGPAEGYTTFGSTDENGVATTTIPTADITQLHFREILKEGYIPFTAVEYPNNSNDVSAEFYCGTDIYNYDNYEGVGLPEDNTPIIPGDHYHCVAWNVATTHQNPGEGKIHVIKFIDGVRATKESANDAMFPMFINPSNGDFMLRSDGWVAGDGEYEATTFVHPKGTTYTINENLSTPLVGASCNGQTPYALAGYSTAATYEGAVAAPHTVDAPEITIDGDQYLIVHNTRCRTENNPLFVQAHVYKYLQTPNGTTQIPNDATITPFPMYSTWTEPGEGAGEGYYTLGIYNGGAPLKYASITAKMKSGSDYMTSEQTTTGYVLSPEAQCVPGMYRLVGYKKGIGSLASAEMASITSDGSFTNLTDDAYVIVVNEDCDDLVTETPTDMCPNIEDIQSQVPQGYHLEGEQCIKDSTTGGGGRRSGSSGNGGGGTVLGVSTTAGDNGQVLGDTMCGEYIHSYIRFGKKNDVADVIRLQVFLNQYMGSLIIPNGIYTKETFDVLKAFQVKESSSVLAPWKPTPGGINDAGTGYVYKTTKRWINMIKCPELNLPIPPLTH